MSGWQLHLPHGDRHERIDLGAVADKTREFASEDAAVARSLVLELVCSGAETYGDMFDAIENADQPTRRALLDRAREGAGLLPTERAEQRAAYEAANRNVSSSAPMRVQGRIAAFCSSPGCSRRLSNPDFPGEPARVDATRWWCEAHRAGHEDDLEPYTGPRFAYSATGSIINLDEVEAESRRAEVAAESRRRQREAKEKERAAAAAELERVKEAERERYRRETPTGVWTP